MKISSTKLSIKFNMDRDQLIDYFKEIKYLIRDENNHLSLTEKGLSHGGEYHYINENEKYIVWDENLLEGDEHKEIINSLKQKRIYTTKDKTVHFNYALKKSINDLVDKEYSLNEISNTLQKPYEEIKKIINSLPRIRKKFIAFNSSDELRDNHNTQISSIKTNDMAQDTNTSYHKEVLHHLITGFNPLTGEELPVDSITNNSTIRKVLLEIYESINNRDCNENINVNHKVEKKQIKEEVILKEDESILFETLKKWRNSVATEKGMSAFTILNNQVLKLIAKEKPKTKDEFLAINGMGPTKYEQYGLELTTILYPDDNISIDFEGIIPF